MGSLTEAFEASRKPKGQRCELPKILAKLDPDERAIVEAWLADPDVENAHIARTLTKVGHTIQGQAVGRHRRGDCKCDESPVG